MTSLTLLVLLTLLSGCSAAFTAPKAFNPTAFNPTTFNSPASTTPTARVAPLYAYVPDGLTKEKLYTQYQRVKEGGQSKYKANNLAARALRGLKSRSMEALHKVIEKGVDAACACVLPDVYAFRESFFSFTRLVVTKGWANYRGLKQTGVGRPAVFGTGLRGSQRFTDRRGGYRYGRQPYVLEQAQ